MKSVERQKEILNVLYENGHVTIKSLSNRFDVSERTIRRDIDFLSLTEPIYTKAGRFDGGVYIAKSKLKKSSEAKREKFLVLVKINKYLRETHFLSDEEFIVFESVIKAYEL